MKTVEEAYKARNPGNGVIIHSDSGSQYTSGKYKELLGKHLAVQSMSDVAKCYDNSRMESWFATSKTAPFSDSQRSCAPKAEEQWTVNPPIQVRFLYSPYFCVNYFSNLK